MRRKMSTAGEVLLSKAAVLAIDKSAPLVTQMRMSHGHPQPWLKVDRKPKRKGKGRPRKAQNLSAIILGQKYSGPNPVNPAKKNDLLKLLPLIPPIHHDFFKSIVTSRNDKDKRKRNKEIATLKVTLTMRMRAELT